MPRLMLNIDVPDLEAAVRFYTGAFDLHLGRRLTGGVVELLGAETPLYLLHKPASQAWSEVAPDRRRDYGRHWTPVHIDFVVDDIERALARALTAGAKLEAPVRDDAWGRLALLADPFGHGVCLVQFQNRGYDELVVR